jgi:HSP20 family protein
MSHSFRSFDDLQRELGSVALEITQLRFVGFAVPRGWEPRVNAFLCGGQFVLCLELAGVEPAAVQITVEGRRLTVRGTRPVPEPSCDEAPAIQVLSLEIDHGPFERVLELPAEVEAEQVTAEQRGGLLWIRLPLRSHG